MSRNYVDIITYAFLLKAGRYNYAHQNCTKIDFTKIWKYHAFKNKIQEETSEI
jgi:hypothetical protein